MTNNEERALALCALVTENLRKRGFEAQFVAKKEEVVPLVQKLIPADHLVSWGGSKTMAECGVMDMVKKNYKCVDRDTGKNPAEVLELRRQGLLADTFLMSVNAMTVDGQLLNIDGTGNRAAALVFGPRQVIVVAGVNKIAKTLDAAWERARTVAAPTNIMRFKQKNTPCLKTGMCWDCNSPDSICNQFVRIRRCNPAGRIKVILVAEDLGY